MHPKLWIAGLVWARDGIGTAALRDLLVACLLAGDVRRGRLDGP